MRDKDQNSFIRVSVVSENEMNFGRNTPMEIASLVIEVYLAQVPSVCLSV